MKVSIIVYSCDKCKDCWAPFMRSFELFWPDCEYPIYILSNKETEGFEKATVLRLGADEGWGADMKSAISMIDSEYIIYFQDDYFLSKQVDNDAIKRFVKYCDEEKIGFLKISDDFMLQDKYRISDGDYCGNPIDKKYALNTAIGIWNVKDLDKVCVPGHSAWDFERKILSYVKENNIYIKSQTLCSEVCEKYGIYYILGGALVRGYWTQTGVDFLRKNGFEDRVKNRKIVGPFRTWCFEFKYNHKRKWYTFPIAVLDWIMLRNRINL